MLASMPQHLSLTHTAMAVAIAARPFSSSVLTLTRPRPKWVTLNPVASYSPQPTSSSSAAVSRKLILYSKPGCCLCDGLKEKLHAAFALSSLDSLHDVVLQVRDITTNPEWERDYQYEIPVLARVRSDGTEVSHFQFPILCFSHDFPGWDPGLGRSRGRFKSQVHQYGADQPRGTNMSWPGGADKRNMMNLPQDV
ncbi:hypothetical protein RHGRI_017060 [Rhododendron griersonianum]|uniref:Glutaredoxin-like protein n=1 Tax=Rhododendron griersonianum TaxID=479676 RepID=A0AAV6JWE6_9ERIC|nr:hypothetical protein RHGRI_017060 [Rhododendron griersonianum]